MHTTTRTLALLEISKAAYDEIRAAILKADQPERLKHFSQREAVDLSGIAVVMQHEEGQETALT
jgi:hypothetical protein